MITVTSEQYADFSKTNKLIYDYIAEHYTDISFLSIQELGERIGVSPASLTRFARELGFPGYPAMIKEVQRDLQQDLLPMRAIKTSIGQSGDDAEVLRRTVQQNLQGLENLYSDQLCEQFSRAIDLLLAARRIYVMGMRSSYSMAYYLSFMLAQFMDNVTLLESGSETLFDRLHYTGAEDALFVIGYSRYTRLTVRVAKLFHAQGSPVISLTDSLSSPLAPCSRACLVAPNNNAYSFSSAITVLNALVVGLGGRDKDATLRAMDRREALVLDNGIYL